jgi:WD40 repeat protein
MLTLGLGCFVAPVAAGAAAPPPGVDRDGDPLPAGAVARLGTTRFRLPYPWCLVFSRDGKSLISGGEDGRLHVWETVTGREVHNFIGHARPVSCLALSPDGKVLATAADGDRDVRLWDPATGREVRRLKGPADATCLAFSPDGKLLACGGKGHPVAVWEVATGRPAHWLGDRKGGPAFLALAFSPDGKHLSAGGTDHLVRLWEVGTGKLARTLKGHIDDVVGVAFTPDGKRLVSGSMDRTVRLWELSGGQQLRRFGGEDSPVSSLALSHDGRLVAAGTASGTVRAWDADSGKALWRGEESFMITSLAFSPDGKALAASTRHGIGLWEAGSGKCRHTTTGAGGVCLLAYSPDGGALAVAHADQSVWQWDTRQWRSTTRGRVRPGEVSSLRFGPNRKLLAVRQTESGLALWDVSADRVLGKVSGATPTAISPGGDAVATYWQEGTGGFALWQAATGKRLRYFPSGDLSAGPGQVHFPIGVRYKAGPVPCIDLSPDGALLAIPSGGISVWDTRTSRHARVAEDRASPGFVAFAPDGRSILSQDHMDKTERGRPLYLWEVASGTLRMTLEGRGGKVAAAAFSPDGRLLAVAGFDNDCEIWDLASGKRVARVAGHRGRVTALAFSPDGETLASGGVDTSVLAWQLGRLVPRSERSLPKVADRRMEGLWQELDGSDAAKAYRVVWALARQAGRVEAFLKRKLETPAASPAQVRRLISELDSDDFFTRQTASRELERLGRLVESDLREAARRRQPPEAARRLRDLMGKLDRGSLGAEAIRRIRALEVLHRVGTIEARRLLERFGKDGRK